MIRSLIAFLFSCSIANAGVGIGVTPFPGPGSLITTGGGGVAVIQAVDIYETSDSSFPRSISITSSTAGNDILVFIGNGGNDTVTYTVTDSGSSTYTSLFRATRDGAVIEVFRATNVSGITSVTVTPSSNYIAVNIAVAEMSGASGVDDGNTAKTYAGYVSSGTTPSITTTNASDIVFGVVLAQGPVVHTSSDCTNIFQQPLNEAFFAAFKTVSSTGSYGCSWTNTGGGAGQDHLTFAIGQQ